MDLDTLKSYLDALGINVGTFTDDQLASLLKLKTSEVADRIGTPIIPVEEKDLIENPNTKTVLTRFYPLVDVKVILDDKEITPVKINHDSGILYFKKEIKGEFLEIEYSYGLDNKADEVIATFIADYLLHKTEGTEGSEGSIGGRRIKSKTLGDTTITYDYADKKGTAGTKGTNYQTAIDKWLAELKQKYNHRVRIL